MNREQSRQRWANHVAYPTQFYYLCPWLTALSSWYRPYRDYLDQLEFRPMFKEAYLRCLKGESVHVIEGNYICAELIDGDAYFAYRQGVQYWQIPLIKSTGKMLSTTLVRSHYSMFNPSGNAYKYLDELKHWNPNFLTFM